MSGPIEGLPDMSREAQANMPPAELPYVREVGLAIEEILEKFPDGTYVTMNGLVRRITGVEWLDDDDFTPFKSAVDANSNIGNLRQDGTYSVSRYLDPEESKQKDDRVINEMILRSIGGAPHSRSKKKRRR